VDGEKRIFTGLRKMDWLFKEELNKHSIMNAAKLESWK
jgi:hypothetical protein